MGQGASVHPVYQARHVNNKGISKAFRKSDIFLVMHSEGDFSAHQFDDISSTRIFLKDRRERQEPLYLSKTRNDIVGRSTGEHDLAISINNANIHMEAITELVAATLSLPNLGEYLSVYMIVPTLFHKHFLVHSRSLVRMPGLVPEIESLKRSLERFLRSP